MLSVTILGNNSAVPAFDRHPTSQVVTMDGNNYLAYHLEPLTKVHLYSALAGFEPNGSITYNRFVD